MRIEKIKATYGSAEHKRKIGVGIRKAAAKKREKLLKFVGGGITASPKPITAEYFIAMLKNGMLEIITPIGLCPEIVAKLRK